MIFVCPFGLVIQLLFTMREAFNFTENDRFDRVSRFRE
jgi:hypothetical protein